MRIVQYKGSDYYEVRQLRQYTLPDDAELTPHELRSSTWYLVEDPGSYPVGYLGLQAGRKVISLGVLASHRGHGLQRRLLRRAAKTARALGTKVMTSYVSGWNVHSLRNFVLEGWVPVRHEHSDEPPSGFLHVEKYL